MADGEILRPQGEQLLLAVQVVPRASRTALAGLHGGRLKIRLAAPPVEGAANRELVRYLASRLRLPRSQLAITRGGSGKRKTVAITGLDAETVRRRLELP